MLAVADEPIIRARMHPVSVEDYHRFCEAGFIAERTELIRGAIIDQMVKSPLHSSIVELLRDDLLLQVPSGWTLRSEQPLTLADSEPEPDLATVASTRADYFSQHPTTAALVIEVCVSSEDLDRLKLSLYAEAGVTEVWLILAEGRSIERHTSPQAGVYQQVERVAYPGTLESTVFASLRLPPAGLFPG